MMSSLNKHSPCDYKWIVILTKNQAAIARMYPKYNTVEINDTIFPESYFQWCDLEDAIDYLENINE